MSNEPKQPKPHWSVGYELKRINIIQIARQAKKTDEEIEELLKDYE